MELNFDVEPKSTPTEDNIVTEKTNDDKKEQKENKQEMCEKAKRNNSSSSFNPIIKYFVSGLIMISIVCMIIFVCYKSFKTQNNNLGALLEKARKDEAILNGRVQMLEKEKQLYMHKINQLNNELQMRSDPYSSTLPMTQHSYDAPDPDTPKEKPKLLKDKEAIKAYVNSKRTTVQDELEEQRLEKEEIQRKLENKTKGEIQEQIQSNVDEDLEQEDDKVNEIMNII